MGCTTSAECRDAIQALVDFLSQAEDLTELQLNAEMYLSPTTMQLLSLLPHLASLQLSCRNRVPISFEEPTTQARFISLSDLSLLTPISMAMDFARLGCSLSSFKLICENRASSGLENRTSADLENWLMNSNACYGRDLRCLHICFDLEGVWDGSGLVTFVFGISLTELSLDLALDIADQTLVDLGSALPFLESFDVALQHIPDRKATVWGVLSFLARCPRMKSLEMEFNAMVEKEELWNHTVPKSNLTRLSVGLSPINDAGLIAELFGEVFPRLEMIVWDEEEEEEDEEDGEETNDVRVKWELVWDAQQAVQRMREQLCTEIVGGN
jgi:hypothetical protein